jgi:hypothetical protein
LFNGVEIVLVFDILGFIPSKWGEANDVPKMLKDMKPYTLTILILS